MLPGLPGFECISGTLLHLPPLFRRPTAPPSSPPSRLEATHQPMKQAIATNQTMSGQPHKQNTGGFQARAPTSEAYGTTAEVGHWQQSGPVTLYLVYRISGTASLTME